MSTYAVFKTCENHYRQTWLDDSFYIHDANPLNNCLSSLTAHQLSILENVFEKHNFLKLSGTYFRSAALHFWLTRDNHTCCHRFWTTTWSDSLPNFSTSWMWVWTEQQRFNKCWREDVCEDYGRRFTLQLLTHNQ
jgi:hypothetical protein